MFNASCSFKNLLPILKYHSKISNLCLENKVVVNNMGITYNHYMTEI